MDCKSILHFAWFRAIYYVMKDITDSQFYMWRTLFAIVHVDDMVTEEEVHFMAEAQRIFRLRRIRLRCLKRICARRKT